MEFYEKVDFLYSVTQDNRELEIWIDELFLKTYEFKSHIVEGELTQQCMIQNMI